MRIGEDFDHLKENEYLFILNKVYAQLRHVVYVRLKHLANFQKKSKQRLRYVSGGNFNNFSYDEDIDSQNTEDSSNCLSSATIENEIQKVDLNQILLDVLKLFDVECAHVDRDAHLIMRKLEFCYLNFNKKSAETENYK